MPVRPGGAVVTAIRFIEKPSGANVEVTTLWGEGQRLSTSVGSSEREIADAKNFLAKEIQQQRIKEATRS